MITWSLWRQEWSERTQIEVEVASVDVEALPQFRHRVLQPHEGEAELLHLIVREITCVDATQCLAFHQLADQLDDGEDETDQVTLDLLGIGLQPTR